MTVAAGRSVGMAERVTATSISMTRPGRARIHPPAAPEADVLAEAHRPRWDGYFKWLVVVTAFALGEAAMAWCVLREPAWLLPPLTLLLGFLMHGQLMALHEAAHRSLVPVRWVNEAIGITIGTLSFTGLTAYRAVHRTHHAHLATERDEELWPFVVPGTPLWVRRGAMVASLLLGIVWMPVLCLRTFLRRGSVMRNPAERRRAWFEYVGMVVFWTAAAVAVARFQGWMLFAALYAVPSVVAGSIHGIRESVEHLGLAGRTTLGSTRSIIPSGPVGRTIAFTWFNIEYHGAHHLYGGIPHGKLPDVIGLLALAGAGDVPPYQNYRSAVRDMLRSVNDPRIGRQWLEPRK
jgi:fatty acid desaturase